MAESMVVNELIKKLISFGIEEIGLASGAKKEVNKLRGSLNKIQAVLQDAERKQVGNEAVRLWLKDLKDVAYEAEDLLNEIAYEDLRWKVENDFAAKVRNFFTPSINPLVLRFKIAHEIKDINQKLDDIVKVKDRFQLIEGPINVNGENVVDRETSPFVDDSAVVGRESDVSKIVDLLFDESSNQDNGSLSVIPIVGLGGLGKTTLAQLLYNNEDVGKHFNLKFWVCVSDDFVFTSILKEIIDQIPNCKCEASTLIWMQTKLQEQLNGKKLLLVLDDVWNENRDRWDTLSLSLRCAGPGSKIIVTTRSNDVASIVGTLPTYYLRMLSEDDCWTVFERRAFQTGGAERTSCLEAIGRKIVKKCGGLPLAAKSLGGFMHSKREEQEWLDVLNNEIWNMPDEQNKIIEVLKLSYNNLSPQLKQCFSYCSIFPKDYKIEKKTLIQLWMAQGFFETSKRNELMEDVGNGYVNVLCSKSFFQDVEKDEFGEITAFKMHDLIHDLAQSVAKSQCRTVEITNMDREDLSGCRHISILTLDGQNSTIPNVNCEEKKLRSFWIRGTHPYSTVRGFSFDTFFILKALRLRALDLSKTDISEVPLSISELKHLRYLDLSHTNIQVLPPSLTQLYNLQTLKLIKCERLKGLPIDLKNLVNLRHLLVLNITPREMGQLRHLQTFTCFSVGKGEDAGRSITELGSLSFLQGDLRIDKLENVKDAASAKRANLIEKQKLRSLELDWDSSFRLGQNSKFFNDIQVAVLKALQPHCNLKKLVIEGFAGNKFPAWVTSGLALSSLVKLCIFYCQEVKHIGSFGGLPNLKILHISNTSARCLGGDSWTNGGSSSIEKDAEEATVRRGIEMAAVVAYPSLKRIELCEMPCLEEWLEIVSPHFPCLEELLVKDCPKLGKMPHLFPSLKALDFQLSVGGIEERLVNIYHTSLTSLLIHDNKDLTVIPEGLLLKNNVLESLEIHNCPKLQAFIRDSHINANNNNSSLRFLEIRSCSSLRSMPDVRGLTSLQRLTIEHCKELEVTPDGFFLHFLPFLRYLSVSACPKLRVSVHTSSFASLRWMSISRINALSVAYDDNSTTITPSSLSKVSIHSIPEFVGFSAGFLQNNKHLREVAIGYCPKFQGFLSNGQQQQQLLHSSLEEVWVYNCPSASSVHLQGLVRLRELYISNCRGLKSLEGLESLTTLEKLTIGGPFSEELDHSLSSLEHNNLISLWKLEILGSTDLNYLPLHRLQHLTMVTSLRISEFNDLMALPEWLGELTSLKYLEICKCAKLTHLPSAETMKRLISLCSLCVEDCPLLEERCERRKIRKKYRVGAEWQKISHIPHVVFKDSKRDEMERRKYYSSLLRP